MIHSLEQGERNSRERKGVPTMRGRSGGGGEGQEPRIC